MTKDARLPVQEHIRIVYILFATTTVASFVYCLVLSQFNGDFFPQPVFLSSTVLLVVLGACLAPYALTWKLAGVLDRIRPSITFEVPNAVLLVFLLAGFFCHFAITLLFGVGVMDTEVYTAPALVRPFIQILNRLDPFYLGAFFILATPKRANTDLLAVVLMVAIGLLRAGIGAFAYVIISLSVKYRHELIRAFRRAPWLVILGATVTPAIINTLYQVRGQLRGDMQLDFTLSDMFFGRFVGRLSAFSNVSFIVQNGQSFEWASKMLEPYFYAKQALTSVLGAGVAPLIVPEQLLIAGNRSYEGFSTFMAGVPGNLIMAWNVSPWVALFNLGLMAACVTAILWLSRYFANGAARAFGPAMLIYPLTSGVANEFASLLLNTMIFLAFTILFARRNPKETTVYGT